MRTKHVHLYKCVVEEPLRVLVCWCGRRLSENADPTHITAYKEKCTCKRCLSSENFSREQNQDESLDS